MRTDASIDKMSILKMLQIEFWCILSFIPILVFFVKLLAQACKVCAMSMGSEHWSPSVVFNANMFAAACGFHCLFYNKF